MNIQEKIVEEHKEICEIAEMKRKYIFPSAYEKHTQINRVLPIEIILKPKVKEITLNFIIENKE